MALVDHLSKFPFAIDDPFGYGRAWALLCNRIRKASDEEFAKVVGAYSAGWSLLCFIARDIPGPHTRYEHPRTGNKHRRPHYEPFVFARTVSDAFQRRRKSGRNTCIAAEAI